MKPIYWLLLGVAVVAAILLTVASYFVVPVFFLSSPMMAGAAVLPVLASRGMRPGFDLIFDGFRNHFGRHAITNLILFGISLVVYIVPVIFIVVALFAAAGVSDGAIDGEMFAGVSLAVLLLFLPLVMLLGAILYQMSHFSSMLIADKGVTVGAAISASLKLRFRFFFQFLGIEIAFFFMYLVLLPTGIGALFLLPWVLSIYAVIYRKAFDGEETEIQIPA